MRAALVVVMLALLSACRPDEPDDVAVVSEPPAPQQADVLQPLPVALRPVQIQDEAKCRQVLALEAQLQQMLTQYTERHPQVIATRSDIGRLRSELPADGTFCSPNSDQQQQRPTAVQVQGQIKDECRQLVALEADLQQALTKYTEQHPDVVRLRSVIGQLRNGFRPTALARRTAINSNKVYPRSCNNPRPSQRRPRLARDRAYGSGLRRALPGSSQGDRGAFDRLICPPVGPLQPRPSCRGFAVRPEANSPEARRCTSLAKIES